MRSHVATRRALGSLPTNAPLTVGGTTKQPAATTIKAKATHAVHTTSTSSTCKSAVTVTTTAATHDTKKAVLHVKTTTAAGGLVEGITMCKENFVLPVTHGVQQKQPQVATSLRVSKVKKVVADVPAAKAITPTVSALGTPPVNRDTKEKEEATVKPLAGEMKEPVPNPQPPQLQSTPTEEVALATATKEKDVVQPENAAPTSTRQTYSRDDLLKFKESCKHVPQGLDLVKFHKLLEEFKPFTRNICVIKTKNASKPIYKLLSHVDVTLPAEPAESTTQKSEPLSALMEFVGTEPFQPRSENLPTVQADAPTSIYVPDEEFLKQKALSRSGGIEENAVRLAARQKQIDFGVITDGYRNFVKFDMERQFPSKYGPVFPNKFQNCSKRSWDGQVKKWRRDLHFFDQVATEKQFEEALSKLKAIALERRQKLLLMAEEQNCGNNTTCLGADGCSGSGFVDSSDEPLCFSEDALDCKCFVPSSAT